MKREYFCLKKLRPGDTLSEMQSAALNDLITNMRRFREDESIAFDTQACYLYASLAEAGMIEEDSAFVDWLYRTVLVYSLIFESKEAYKKYPLAFRYGGDLLP